MDPILEDKDELKHDNPKMWNVVFLNDDFTPMDFVVAMLQNYHSKNLGEAKRIMMDVHEKGKGIAGTYTYEIAETKSFIVNQRARINGFPLVNVIEEIS
ncbi:MAG: ATP-dependent Clp protease adaptor ClpS [Proteobacteria bacterium]|nr:ATP-dependent Clp protease adaptor ClpS [Pseudomonadota bacterium]